MNESETLTFSGCDSKESWPWLLWRGVYVTKFPGLDGQLRLLVDWILDAFLPRDITQLRLFHEENVHREHFEKGETIFSNGDTGDKVYFIVKGEVTVERDGTTLAALRDGEVFGEAALLTKQPRNATLRAATTLDAVVVSREASFPGTAWAFAGRTASDARDYKDAHRSWGRCCDESSHYETRLINLELRSVANIKARESTIVPTFSL
jgi:hypothetical protein